MKHECQAEPMLYGSGSQNSLLSPVLGFMSQ